MNVHIVYSSSAYHELFKSLGCAIISNPLEADFVVFTGGADVSPELYGDMQHHYTHNDLHRDEEEYKIFHECQKRGIKMVGICRGGQFLNVMSGGRMYQHVGSHTQNHVLVDLQSHEEVLVSSTHHQMMMPSPKGLLVATASQGGSREWFDKDVPNQDTSIVDIEVVWYEHTQCLCFQPHPEFGSEAYAPMKKYFASLLERFSFI